jgi:hypothetical protein
VQAEVAATREFQRVKEAMARQAHKDAADLKKKLEDTEQKDKDAVSDLQDVVESKSLIMAQELTLCALYGLDPYSPTLNPCRRSRV